MHAKNKVLEGIWNQDMSIYSQGFGDKAGKIPTDLPWVPTTNFQQVFFKFSSKVTNFFTRFKCKIHNASYKARYKTYSMNS